MENTDQEITVKFDNAEFKDLLIHQIAINMKQHWNTDDVIELFLNPSFNFNGEEKTKAQKVSELMETHKVALLPVML